MAKIGLKQLDTTLSGSLQVSGSSIVTGSLTVTQLGRFSDVQVTDDLNVTDDVGIGGVLTATGGTVLGNADSDTHTIIGHVTSSGNISSSAAIISSEVTASNAKVTGTLTVHDDVVVGEYVSHKGDANTRINFTDDRIQLEAGGINFFGAHKKASSPHLFTINNGSNNIDFQVKDNSNNTLFRTDADSQLVRFPDALIVSGSSTATASFGTYIGDGSQLTGITSVTTASIQNLGIGIISGSSQLPSGIISGSGQLPSGIVSGSSQITSILPSGTISGSVQITQNSGILSGSIASQLPDGVISGSLQLPSGLISGSTQISESGFVSSSTTNIIEVMTSASYAAITPVTGTLYIIQG